MAEFHVAIAALCGTTGGPATYARRLVDALARQGSARLSVVTDAPQAFEQAAATGDVDVVDLPMRGGLDRLRWQYLALPRALRKLAPDVFHDTKNALPFRLPCPAVVTVHDLAYHTVPETFGLASRTFLRRATRDAVRRSRAIVVPSASTRRDLERYYPDSSGRIHVVPHGIDEAPRLDPDHVRATLQRLGVEQPYVLHVGTIQQRKNVDLVVAGVRELRARGLPHRSLVVGRQGWLAERALQEIARDDRTTWIEHLDADDLEACYAGADAFVSPSSYEGFGFAVADALAAGVPTIIADISSLPELCDDAAVRLSELTYEAVADALHGLLTEPRRPDRLRERGRRRAARFSWDAAALGHLEAYRRAATRR